MPRPLQDFTFTVHGEGKLPAISASFNLASPPLSVGDTNVRIVTLRQPLLDVCLRDRPLSRDTTMPAANIVRIALPPIRMLRERHG